MTEIMGNRGHERGPLDEVEAAQRAIYEVVMQYVGQMTDTNQIVDTALVLAENLGDEAAFGVASDVFFARSPLAAGYQPDRWEHWRYLCAATEYPSEARMREAWALAAGLEEAYKGRGYMAIAKASEDSEDQARAIELAVAAERSSTMPNNETLHWLTRNRMSEVLLDAGTLSGNTKFYDEAFQLQRHVTDDGLIAYKLVEQFENLPAGDLREALLEQTVKFFTDLQFKGADAVLRLWPVLSDEEMKRVAKTLGSGNVHFLPRATHDVYIKLAEQEGWLSPRRLAREKKKSAKEDKRWAKQYSILVEPAKMAADLVKLGHADSEVLAVATYDLEAVGADNLDVMQRRYVAEFLLEYAKLYKANDYSIALTRKIRDSLKPSEERFNMNVNLVSLGDTGALGEVVEYLTAAKPWREESEESLFGLMLGADHSLSDALRAIATLRKLVE